MPAGIIFNVSRSLVAHEIPLKVGSHDPISIENFSVRHAFCWCSHDPVFAANYFVTSSKHFNKSRFENFMPTSLQLDPAVVTIL